MADNAYSETEGFRNPTLRELAVMPDYLREFHLRYWKGDCPFTPEEVAAAVEGAVQEEFEVVRGKAVKRQVYFIQAETGPIKIGVASDVRKRLGNLRGASPVPLTLLLSISGGPMAEYSFHHKFRAHRLHGEWFHPHPDILAEIERLSQ